MDERTDERKDNKRRRDRLIFFYSLCVWCAVFSLFLFFFLSAATSLMSVCVWPPSLFPPRANVSGVYQSRLNESTCFFLFNI